MCIFTATFVFIFVISTHIHVLCVCVFLCVNVCVCFVMYACVLFVCMFDRSILSSLFQDLYVYRVCCAIGFLNN